jgi:hypothetical protein
MLIPKLSHLTIEIMQVRMTRSLALFAFMMHCSTAWNSLALEQQAEMDRKSAADDLRSVREELEQKRRASHSASLVEMSTKSANRVSAYCLSCMNAISVRDEKGVLLKTFQPQEMASR